MNAPFRTDFTVIPANREATDDRMDQIRDLLFGELQKQNDARFVEMTLRLREIETVFARRLDTLQSRLDALSSEISAGHRSAFDDLSRGVQDLGERIRRISQS
jgi:hypothetical protein